MTVAGARLGALGMAGRWDVAAYHPSPGFRTDLGADDLGALLADDARTGTSVYLLDVYDHLVQAIDGIHLCQDMVATALSAQVSVASRRLDETMRAMTALATILMTMALVTGVYGMSFAAIPELAWQ